MYLFKIIPAISIFLFAGVTHADLPLTVEDILADKSR
ncbi:Uncharacterised protein [Moraxella ovis]|nr:Uncharacterised protein [Moraxella ovis]STZ06144.1 Uncharacterised protein [Moraxella ovis]